VVDRVLKKKIRDVLALAARRMFNCAAWCGNAIPKKYAAGFGRLGLQVLNFSAPVF
jgi:hypothetical protein